MYLYIKFLGGARAPATYFYKNKDLFKPAFYNRSAEPLRLTDFKEIEVVTSNVFTASIKCTFIDGRQSLALVPRQTLYLLQGFVFSASQMPFGQTPPFPKDYTDTILIGTVIILSGVSIILSTIALALKLFLK